MRSYEIPNIHFFRVNSVNLPKELHHFTPAAGFGAGTCQQPPVIEKSESWTPGSYGENIISTNLEILFYLSGDNYLWLLSHPSHVIFKSVTNRTLDTDMYGDCLGIRKPSHSNREIPSLRAKSHSFWENMGLHGFNIHDTSVSFVHCFKTIKNHHFPCSKLTIWRYTYIIIYIYILNTLPFETLYPSTPTGSGQDADHGAECDSRSLKRCCRKPGNMTVMAWLGVPCWHIQRGPTSATASCWKNLVMVNIHAAWWLQPDWRILLEATTSNLPQHEYVAL